MWSSFRGYPWLVATCKMISELYFIFFCIAVVIVIICTDKLVNKATRITRYYVIRVKKDKVVISHEPILMYNQDRVSFLSDRDAAYRKIAEYLKSNNLSVDVVTSSSVWLKYDSGWCVSKLKNTPTKRLTSVLFHLTNLNNWTVNQGKSWYAIGSDTYNYTTIPVDAFIEKYTTK